MRPRRSGMSLFEITIVMLVLGILAAVAAPRFSDSFQNSKLVAAANQIAGHIDYVRRVAINEGKTTNLHCNSTTDRYYSDVSLPHLPNQLLDVEIKTVHDPTFELTADFDGNTSLSFNFEGVPHVGGSPMQSGKLTISHAGRSLDIVIAAGTGNTSVVDTSQEEDEYDDYYSEPQVDYY